MLGDLGGQLSWAKPLVRGARAARGAEAVAGVRPAGRPDARNQEWGPADRPAMPGRPWRSGRGLCPVRSGGRLGGRSPPAQHGDLGLRADPRPGGTSRRPRHRLVRPRQRGGGRAGGRRSAPSEAQARASLGGRLAPGSHGGGHTAVSIRARPRRRSPDRPQRRRHRRLRRTRRARLRRPGFAAEGGPAGYPLLSVAAPSADAARPATHRAPACQSGDPGTRSSRRGRAVARLALDPRPAAERRPQGSPRLPHAKRWLASASASTQESG